MTRTDARLALVAHSARLEDGTVTVRSGLGLAISYAEVGRTVDYDTMLDRAAAVGRDGTRFAETVAGLRQLAEPVSMAPLIGFDRDRLAEVTAVVRARVSPAGRSMPGCVRWGRATGSRDRSTASGSTRPVWLPRSRRRCSTRPRQRRSRHGRAVVGRSATTTPTPCGRQRQPIGSPPTSSWPRARRPGRSRRPGSARGSRSPGPARAYGPRVDASRRAGGPQARRQGRASASRPRPATCAPGPGASSASAPPTLGRALDVEGDAPRRSRPSSLPARPGRSRGAGEGQDDARGAEALHRRGKRKAPRSWSRWAAGRRATR